MDIINKYSKIITIIFIGIILTALNANFVEAIEIKAKSNIAIGEEITVTLDFGTYIAAYDSLVVTYNERIMKYNSPYSLIEGLWWDTSTESKGIDKKVYSFTGTGNGTSTINIKIKGLVSANDKMDVLGDIELNKKITIGTGNKKGDLDGNGVVNANDAALVLDIYKYGNFKNDDILVSDMDNNGVINANDAAIILDMYKYNK